MLIDSIRHFIEKINEFKFSFQEYVASICNQPTAFVTLQKVVKIQPFLCDGNHNIDKLSSYFRPKNVTFISVGLSIVKNVYL